MKLYTEEVKSCLGHVRNCPHSYWPEVNYVRFTCAKENREIFKDAPENTDNYNYIPDWCPLEDVKNELNNRSDSKST